MAPAYSGRPDIPPINASGMSIDCQVEYSHDCGLHQAQMTPSPDALRPRFRPALAAGFLLVSQCFAQPANAERLESLSADVGYGHYYDSNLYRVGDGRTGPNGKRHDNVTTASAGLHFNQTYSRQRLSASLGVERNRYAVNSNLDHNAHDARAAWDWELGKRWSGRFSYDSIEKLAGFDDFVDTERSINTYRRKAGEARFMWHPSWSVGLGVDDATNRFTGETRRSAEFDARTVILSLGWHPASGNKLGVSYHDSDGTYINRPKTAGSTREYQQRELRLNTRWQMTGAIRMSGYIGQTRRSYDLAPNRDFSGPTGRLEFDWTPTGKLAVNLALRREIGSEDDLVTTFAVTRAVKISPSWAITDKVTLGAEYQRWRRDFRGDSGLSVAPEDLPSRDDVTQRYGLSLRYKPIDALTLTVMLRHQERNAKTASREYESDSASVSVRFAF